MVDDWSGGYACQYTRPFSPTQPLQSSYNSRTFDYEIACSAFVKVSRSQLVLWRTEREYKERENPSSVGVMGQISKALSPGWTGLHVFCETQTQSWLLNHVHYILQCFPEPSHEVLLPEGPATQNWHQRTSCNKGRLTSPVSRPKSCSWTHRKDHNWQPTSLYVLHLWGGDKTPLHSTG